MVLLLCGFRCKCIVVMLSVVCCCVVVCLFFFQAEDGIRDLVRSRGLGDVYKRQDMSVITIGSISYFYSILIIDMRENWFCIY